MNNSSQFHSHLEAPTPTPMTPIQNRPAGRAIVNRGPFVRKPMGTGGFLTKSTSYKRAVTK